MNNIPKDKDLSLLAEKIINETNEVEWDKYEKLLKNHDWYYEMSDDNRYYTSGLAASKEIRSIKDKLSKIDSKRATELFNKYAPGAR